MSRSMLIAPPSLTATPSSTLFPSRNPSTLHPPTTPHQPTLQPTFATPAHARKAQTSNHTPVTTATFPASSSSSHTPLKPSPAYLAPPPPTAFHTPAHPNHYSASSSSSAPSSHATPAAAPNGAGVSTLSTMSEAESQKLMLALNQFVLVALQQQSSAYTTTVTTGRVTESKNYQTLLSQLQAQHPDPLALSRWYAALSKSVASFHPQHHAELIQLIYSFNFNEAASLRNVEVLINLLVAMCVGGNQIHALGPALKTLVNTFIATNVPFATISAASVSPALYGQPGELVPPDLALGEAALSPTSSTTLASGGHELPTMDGIHDLVHSALTRLMHLVPSSPTVLFPLLVETFPHKRNDVTIQLVYVKNLLRVSEYAGSLRDRILTTIIERMIHIDVEIVHAVDADGDGDHGDSYDAGDGSVGVDGVDFGEDEFPRDEPDLMFTMSTGENGATSVTLDPSEPISESRIMADKLDSLMCLMFEYLNLIRIASETSAKASTPKAIPTPQTPGTLIASATSTPPSNGAGGGAQQSNTQIDLCDEVFASLLRVFERSILRTHNSRFLQYLLFYYCSFKHIYAETFLKYLLEKGFDVQISGVERQNCALYIASFVARASFLRHASAILAFEMVLKWTHAYTEYHVKTSQAALLAAQQNVYTRHAGGGVGNGSGGELIVPEVGPLEASQHAVFYRMCQAVFYIFCYRQASFRDMMEQNPDVLHSLRLDTLIFSPLNPLRYISQTVIDEFLRVNAQLGIIVQCQELVERNHRLNQSSRIGVQGGNGMMGSHGSNRSHPSHAHHHQTSPAESSNGGLDGPTMAGSATRFDPNDIFFPFDPYQLKHSSAYVDNLYITYQDEEDQVDEEEEESSSESDSDDDDGDSIAMDDRSRANSPRLSRPIRIGVPIGHGSGNGNGRARARGGRRSDGYTNGGSDISSMSASFSEQLSVDDDASSTASRRASYMMGTPHSHSPPLGVSVNMSFEMEAGSHMKQFLTPSTVETKKTKKKTKNKKSKAAHSSSDDDDDWSTNNRNLMLSEQDLSFSPNSPAFAPLDDTPQGKRR